MEHTIDGRRWLAMARTVSLGVLLAAVMGCGATADPTGDTWGALTAGPARILVSGSAATREQCAAELAATYCKAEDAAAAAAGCQRRLSGDVTRACGRAGCVIEYQAVRDVCVAGPNYPRSADCDRPVADDCAFYRTCLEGAHACGQAGYALGFGERMCHAFIVRRAAFTTAGQAWLRGVRTCLQRALLPMLHAPTVSCAALGDLAYGSHAGCYTEPGNSFCTLPLGDVWALLNVMSIDLLDPRALHQMGEVAKICLRDGEALAPESVARQALFSALSTAAAQGDGAALRALLLRAGGQGRATE